MKPIPAEELHIFLWGLPPERRLPLRALPCGTHRQERRSDQLYRGRALFEWMEVGFNTFYSYREGETAWIYSKVLHVLHQLTNIDLFLGLPLPARDHNEEAIHQVGCVLVLSQARVSTRTSGLIDVDRK